MKKILIIQTAFIGDVVLATALIESLARQFPDASIDFLLRKGSESLLDNNPHLKSVLVWDKKKKKLVNLFKLLMVIRKNRYDAVINVQRFAATGMLTAFSKAKQKIGFDKNPLSFLFTKKVKHIISTAQNPLHEVDRNFQLIEHLVEGKSAMPAMYPSSADTEKVYSWKKTPYITISPASVWFTKQYHRDKWISFINKIPANLPIYLLGAGSDSALCEDIQHATTRDKVITLCGQLSFLQSTALMKDANMNYVNDSAPMHFASAVNAPVTTIYCSTIPAFGFGPLSDKRYIVETGVSLSCKPCGLHGWKACPKGHFKCALTIQDEQLTRTIQS